MINKAKSILNKFFKKYEVIKIYEYGNGIYAKPFWERVEEQISKIEENYEIIKLDAKYIPAHKVGYNCMGMMTTRGDELFLTVKCVKKCNKGE